MPVVIEARIRFTGIVGMGRRQFRNEFIKPMYEEMGKWWLREIRPKHFTNAGATEYQYTPRAGERGSTSKTPWKFSYTGRKLQKKGHTRPLFFSGELEEKSRRGRFQHQRERMLIRLTDARKANFRNPKSKIRMGSELTRVSQQDAKELIRLGNRYLVARMRNYPRSQIRTV